MMEGGCHCKAIRFRLKAAPFDGDYCHCSVCQKITGAPVSAWIDFKTQDIEWLTEKPDEYASSELIRRGFCKQCGSTLTYRSEDHPHYLTLAITSLDDASVYQPNYHIYTQNKVPWCNIDDQLPRYNTTRS